MYPHGIPDLLTWQGRPLPGCPARLRTAPRAAAGFRGPGSCARGVVDLVDLEQSDLVGGLPSGKHTKKLWKITIFNGTTHYFNGQFQ